MSIKGLKEFLGFDDLDDEETKGSNLMGRIALGTVAVGIVGIAVLISLGQLRPFSAETLDDNFKTQAVSPSVQIGNYCSGTIFDKKPSLIPGQEEYKVITAKHCVKELLEKVQINVDSHEGLKRVGGKSYDALVTNISDKSDIAIITFGTSDELSMAEIAKNPNLEFGQKAYSVSFPAGMSKTLTEGNLGYIQGGGFTDISVSGMFMRSTADTLGGSSGSGLFVKQYDHYVLVGTLTGGLRGNSYTNFYTPTEEINAFLETL